MDSWLARAKVSVCTSEGGVLLNTYVEACKHGTSILSLSVNPDDFLNKYKCGIYAGDNWERIISQLEVPLKTKEREQYEKNAFKRKNG